MSDYSIFAVDNEKYREVLCIRHPQSKNYITGIAYRGVQENSPWLPITALPLGHELNIGSTDHTCNLPQEEALAILLQLK